MQDVKRRGKGKEGDPKNVNTNPPSPPDPSISFIIEKVCMLNSFLESINLVPRSSDTKFVCVKDNDGDDISSIIDPRLSQVVLENPFVEISNMTYDLSLGVVKFTDETDEIAYAFGGYTRDLGSFGEETNNITTLRRSGFKNCSQSLEKASQFLATPSDHTRDGVRKVMTASERSRLKRNPRRFGKATASQNLRCRMRTGLSLRRFVLILVKKDMCLNNTLKEKAKKTGRIAAQVNSGFDEHFNRDSPFDIGYENEVGMNQGGNFSPSPSPQYGSIHPTQQYSTIYPSTPTYPSASYPNVYTFTVHQDVCPQPQSIPQIKHTVSIVNQQTHLAKFSQIDSGLAVPVFKQGHDPIDVISVYCRHISNSANTLGTRERTLGQQRVVKCFNCQREGHMTRHCTEPKMKRDDPSIAEGPVTPTVITNNVVYQADDFDAYDSDCDDITTAKVSLIANLSRYDSDVLSETYKQLYDSIKPIRVYAKEHSEALIDQLNKKSVENSDLNAQLQEKVFVISALKSDLDKLKGKDIVDNAARVSNATTIAPGKYKLDPVILAPRDKNNRETHIYCLKHTMEQVDILRKIVEQAKSLNTLDNESYTACKSKPIGNKKNDKILQPSSSNIKNKVEAQPRKANKKNHVVEPIYDANVKHTLLNANPQLIYVKLPRKKTTHRSAETPKPKLRVYSQRHKQVKNVSLSTKAKIVESKISNNSEPKHSWGSNATGDRSKLTNFVYKFLGTVKFDSNQIAKIIGYGDYQIRNVTISRVYYVEGLGHNLFSVGQFCDSDLEVAFRKHTCFIRDLEGKRNNHINLNLKTPISKKLYLLHMDLCGPMRIASVNRRKYILVIVDDYSRFTWINFLASKYEAPNFIIKFMKIIQVRLNATVRNIRTDNGTEFINQTLHSYYKSDGISHETSVVRTPQQNGVVERRNCTLVEGARTMLIYAKAPLFLWAEAVATACYTQNLSIICRHHGKTPYELLHNRKPDLSYLHVFGALCYPTNDSENLGKLQAKPDIGIFIGYAPKKKAYRIYNRHTRKIIETIHVDFDELTAMVSEQTGLEPALYEMTPATPSSGLVPNPTPLLGIKCSNVFSLLDFALLHEDKICSESKTRVCYI
uniref:Retrovirus-related Pol polyprotein from transposon TNT 1-94 n=1 Tax=Tanacetum cinerariifolium TaxID=118510 RepID=A0A6L2LFL5_TANCI|nr:retrovirus-related Pol polyprotein from transposon TNT 1-94 [Tanacetum cinerariifolium]